MLAKKTLRSVSFRGRVNLTAQLVKALCKNCPYLERIDLGWCDINVASVEEVCFFVVVVVVVAWLLTYYSNSSCSW